MKKLLKRLLESLVESIKYLISTPKVVVIIFVIYFFQGIIHNLGHPVTPALVSDMGTEKFYFGLYFASMSLGMLIGAPIWGALGDRGHKRLYIFIGLLIYSVGQYMFAYVGDKNIMIIFRFMSGFGVSASITLLMTHLIKHSPDDRRKIYLGWFQAMFVLGSSIGYKVAGELTVSPFFIDLINTNDYRVFFLIQAIWNSLHALFIVIVIGKEDVMIIPDSVKESKGFIQGFKELKSLNKNLVIFLISLALISLGAINVSKFIEVYMEDIDLLPKDIGDFVGLTGVVSLAATIVLVPLIAKLKQDFPIMIFIQVISAVIIFIVFRQSDIMIALYTGFMLYVVLKAIYSPLEQHYIASFAPEGKLGTLMGVRHSFFSIGLVVGPLLGGLLYEIAPLWVFDFSALMFVLGFLLLLIVGRRVKNEERQIIE